MTGTETHEIVTHFQLGARTLRVWSDHRNREYPDTPEAWQFLYEPIFAPEVDAGSKLEIAQSHRGASKRLRLSIHLESDHARHQALVALESRHPEFAGRLSEHSISAVRVQKLSISLDDLDLPNGVTLVTSTFFPGSIFTLQFEYSDTVREESLRGFIENSSIRYSYKSDLHSNTEGNIDLWRVSSDSLGVLSQRGGEEYGDSQGGQFRKGFIGAICAFPSNVGISKNWRMCDGGILRKSKFRTLCAIIGNTFGTPSAEEVKNAGGQNPAEWFKLPDYRGYFLRGFDSSQIIDPHRNTHTPQQDSTRMPHNTFMAKEDGLHGHPLRLYTSGSTTQGSAAITGQAGSFRPVPLKAVIEDGLHDHRILGGDSETRPKNMAVYYVIRVF